MCNAGDSDTSSTGKLIASLTTCHITSSGTSAPANGRATRKHTSVNGSRRNSSSSSVERRAISTGMYKPPSGAKPRNTAPRSDVRGASRDVLRYLIAEFFCCCRLKTSGVFTLLADLLQEPFYVRRIFLLITAVRPAQLGHMHRAMCQRFITLPARRDQQRVTPCHRFTRRFLILYVERSPPQHRLGVIQISFHQQALLTFGIREMHHRHLPPQAHQNIVLRVNHAAGGIQNNRRPARVFLKIIQKFVHYSYFFRQVFRFPLRISHTIRPPHPRGHAVNS